MRKIFLELRRNIYVFVLLFLVSFLMSFFITEQFINTNYSYYKLELETSLELEDIFDDDFINTVDLIYTNNEQMPDGWKKISIADIDYKNMIKDIKIDGSNIYIKYKYFPSIVRTSNGTVNDGISRVFKYVSTVLSILDSEIKVNDGVEITGYVSPYIVGLITGFSSLFVLLITIILVTIFSKKEENEKDIIYDNIDIFKFPFKKAYWRHSASCFKKVKNLTLIAILFALMIVCKLINIPSGFGNLGISFTYIIFSILALIYGPICGVVIGFLSDILGYALFQSQEMFFFGYTISAMLTGFIYGICFYRTKITFAKCLSARILVNFLINVVLGTIWWAVIYNLDYESAMSYLIAIALPKNIIYLLPQSIILFLIIKALGKPLSSFSLVDEKITDNITLF
ncbi:MAG: folate family ECF transporter S component [Acholeplasmatales bacterium]|nr:folate family ECF transporter S component [Acholeplasmatales bacterium]